MRDRAFFSRGDNNNEQAKIHWQNVKSFCSRTTGPISIKLDTKRSRGNQASVCEGDSIVLEVLDGPLVFFKEPVFSWLKWRVICPFARNGNSELFKNSLLLFSRYSNSQPKSAQDTFGRRGSKLFKKIALPISSSKKNNSKLAEIFTFMTFLNAIQMKGHNLPKIQVLKTHI